MPRCTLLLLLLLAAAAAAASDPHRTMFLEVTSDGPPETVPATKPNTGPVQVRATHMRVRVPAPAAAEPRSLSGEIDLRSRHSQAASPAALCAHMLVGQRQAEQRPLPGAGAHCRLAAQAGLVIAPAPPCHRWTALSTTHPRPVPGPSPPHPNPHPTPPHPHPPRLATDPPHLLENPQPHAGVVSDGHGVCEDGARHQGRPAGGGGGGPPGRAPRHGARHLPAHLHRQGDRIHSEQQLERGPAGGRVAMDAGLRVRPAASRAPDG